MLEHFGRIESLEVLKDWARVLKPGGILRVSVPDLEKVVSHMKNGGEGGELFIMGAQSDEDDYHKSVWTESKLVEAMDLAGLDVFGPWSDDVDDCSSYPISLNMKAIKPEEEELPAGKLSAIMSVPRYGSNASRGIIQGALKPWKINLITSQGVFWHHLMQGHFEQALADGVDICVAIDYDSCFTSQMFDTLLTHLCEHPEIDALAAVQMRRMSDKPLLTNFGDENITFEGKPVPVSTAHFGLTLFRMECFKDLPKPWFVSRPGPDGGYGDGRMDPDIYFWHHWRECGRTIFMDPQVRIGHVEEMVRYYDEAMQPKIVTISDWRQTFTPEVGYKSNAR